MHFFNIAATHSSFILFFLFINSIHFLLMNRIFKLMNRINRKPIHHLFFLLILLNIFIAYLLYARFVPESPEYSSETYM